MSRFGYYVKVIHKTNLAYFFLKKSLVNCIASEDQSINYLTQEHAITEAAKLRDKKS